MGEKKKQREKTKKKVTRNFRRSLVGFLWRPMKKNKKQKQKKVTRNLQLSCLGESAETCLVFLVTFWNYPARSIDKVSKKKKKKKKRKKVTRNFRLSLASFLWRPMKKSKKQKKSDEKITATLSAKVRPSLFNISCHFLELSCA